MCRCQYVTDVASCPCVRARTSLLPRQRGAAALAEARREDMTQTARLKQRHEEELKSLAQEHHKEMSAGGDSAQKQVAMRQRVCARPHTHAHTHKHAQDTHMWPFAGRDLSEYVYVGLRVCCVGVGVRWWVDGSGSGGWEWSRWSS